MIKTFGTGRLTKEADLRYISTGTAVVNATIACKRTPDKDGNDRTAFVRIVIWGKRAEAFAQFTDKGSLVSFEGEIETDTFEKNGETQFSTKIVVTDFDFLETKEILHDRRAKVESQRQNMTIKHKETISNNHHNKTINRTNNNLIKVRHNKLWK
jgi:single-strand DNA-binding protein